MAKSPKQYTSRLTDTKTGGAYVIFTEKQITKEKANWHVTQFLLAGGKRPKKGETEILAPFGLSDA